VTTALDIQDLRIRRGRRTLIDGASLSAQSGDLIHLSGANGSGKTSLLRVVAGLDERFEGRVVVFGGRPALRRADIAFAPAGDLVWQTLTAEQQLKKILSMSRASRPWAPATALIECIGDEFGKVGGFWLSSGQRRLLTLASVLTVPSRLVLMDEPLNFLSREWELLVAEAIRSACDAGASVLVCSHGQALVGSTPVTLANGAFHHGL
jgi:ABC-type multidrug transport system ATPase subunit